MAGQGTERREVLRVLALAAAAGRLGGFERWAFAHDQGQARVAAAPYVPRFFNHAEHAAITRLADLILPGDDGSPGAREAGVHEFIDFMAWSDPSLQGALRRGLGWLEAHARRRHGRAFIGLSRLQQEEILGRLAYTARHRPGEEEGRAFFDLVREYTVMGFYTSRLGLESLEFPGLDAHAQPPGCPHTDDPEHRRLRPAKG